MSRPKKNNGSAGVVSKKPGVKDGKVASGVGGGKERKKGFQVGPAHAAKNAYLGKAKKIKADLIMKSKLKKSYAKVVQEEGIQSGRLKPRNEATTESTEVSNETGSSKSRDSRPKSTEGKEGGGGSSKRKFSGKGDKRDSRPRGKDLQRSDSTSSTKKAVRALSPGDIGPPMPQSSLRELKKEAFAKYHPAQSRSTIVPARGVTGRSVSGASVGSFGARAKRGQPNMGAKMGLLLEMIKRDKA